jgi:hypothetical protein
MHTQPLTVFSGALTGALTGEFSGALWGSLCRAGFEVICWVAGFIEVAPTLRWFGKIKIHG